MARRAGIHWILRSEGKSEYKSHGKQGIPASLNRKQWLAQLRSHICTALPPCCDRFSQLPHLRVHQPVRQQRIQRLLGAIPAGGWQAKGEFGTIRLALGNQAKNCETWRAEDAGWKVPIHPLATKAAAHSLHHHQRRIQARAQVAADCSAGGCGGEQSRSVHCITMPSCGSIASTLRLSWVAVVPARMRQQHIQQGQQSMQ